MVIKEEWHLDKSLSVGHLLTTIMLVASALAAFYSLSERMAVVEDKIITILENQTKIDINQDQNLAEFRVDMRNRQVAIDTKLENILNYLLQQN
jgi:ABC-type transporter Mla maintaining outer membrane lipid asymmetry ATPase subunit MlaF